MLDLEFEVCTESGQSKAYGEKTSYWIYDGNKDGKHAMDVIDSYGQNIARLSGTEEHLKNMAQLLESIECGRSAPPVFIDSTKTWMYRDSSSIGIGTSPMFALQNWLNTDSVVV